MMNRTSARPWRFVHAAALAVVVSAAGLLTACKGDLLGVSQQSRIPAGSLEDPSSAALLVNGAVSDFECAFGAYVVAGGLIGEELADATQTADRYPYDQRTLTSKDTRYQTQSCAGIGVYSPLQTARVSANNVRRLLEGWTDAQVPNRQTLLATASVYEGYSQLLLGEGFCSTVFSSFNADKTLNYGTEITPAQAYDSAITRFTEAIDAATAAGATQIKNLALVGRARAELDKGDLVAARADAVQVPAGFRYDATASDVSSRRYNRVWQDNGPTGQASSVGAPYRNLSDPRVPVQNLNKSSVTGVPIWLQLKYPSPSSPIRLASYDEAQLIIAEADIASNPTNTVLIINNFRAQGNEGPYAGALDSASLLAEVIDQRRRSLFLEGQHLGDLIRYNLPFNPAVGTPFPGGGVYGSQRCMPLPDVEKNNNPLLGA